MEQDSLIINYQHQMAQECANELTIDTAPAAAYWCRYRDSGMPVRQLGIHYIALTENDADLQKVYRVIKAYDLLESPLNEDLPMVGTLCKIFSLRKKDQHCVNIIDAYAPPPQALRDLENALLNFLERVNLSPVRALSIECNITPGTLHSGKNITVNIRLINRGELTVQFGNPASFKVNSGDVIKLNLYKHVVDDTGSDNLMYTHSIDLANREYVLDSQTVLPSEQTLLSLAPSVSIEAKVSMRFPKCDPGIYTCELIYIYIDDPAENEKLVCGEYHCDPIDITVERKK